MCPRRKGVPPTYFPVYPINAWELWLVIAACRSDGDRCHKGRHQKYACHAHSPPFLFILPTWLDLDDATQAWQICRVSIPFPCHVYISEMEEWYLDGSMTPMFKDAHPHICYAACQCLYVLSTSVLIIWLTVRSHSRVLLNNSLTLKAPEPQ